MFCKYGKFITSKNVSLLAHCSHGVECPGCDQAGRGRVHPCPCKPQALFIYLFLHKPARSQTMCTSAYFLIVWATK